MRRHRYQIYRLIFIFAFLGLVYYNFVGLPSSSSGSRENERASRRSNVNNVDIGRDLPMPHQSNRQEDGLRVIEMPKLDDKEVDGEKVRESFRKHQEKNEEAFRNPNNPGPVPDFIDEHPQAEQVNHPALPEKKSEESDLDGPRKKDWHNYQQIAEENQRKGPGEQGSAYIMTPDEAKSSQKGSLFSQNGFNALASDKISLERSLNDIRHNDCKKKTYLAELPKVSIVIPFHDEHFSTLLRSVYSIVKRTPPELLGEIILVDDASTKDFLQQKLEDYVTKNFGNELVRILRNKKREGLIRTRMAGANQAKYDILIFFDSHIECNVNWLPPLIEPIVKNYTTAVCPFIDVINDDTFAYSAQDNGARGAFDWELFYKRLPLIDEDKRSPTEPFESPVMAGGLFAISKKWFYELGGYDEGLEIWGGEQYELSFKIWQCGGRLVDAPCSRVGHIYRKFNPFSAHVGVGDFLSKNYKRVAEIWMDEYKEFIYKKRPYMKTVDPGDISSQLKIRKDLKCRPFKWFMETVAFDLEKYYPSVPPEPYAHGEIRGVESKMCVDTKFKGSHSNFGLDLCQSSNKDVGGEQKFELSWRSDIRPRSRNVCWDVSSSNKGTPVILFECHGYRGNQEFRYNMRTLQIFHPISHLCLDSNKDRKEIFMNECSSTSDSQKWQFESVNSTLIDRDFKF